MLKNPGFLILFSFKLCGYCQESNKENSDFSIFENIRVTLSLEGTFTHMKKPVRLQVYFDKKSKPWKFRFANFYPR